MPPRHLTLVGAGNGSGPWVQWLLSRAVPSATLVEADDALIAPLQAAVANAPGPWRVRKQVVGPETATVTFHVASVSSESGLLEPESLRGLWPNLKTRQKQTRQAITLDELLQDDEPSANWLIVDCWPALPLLQGGPQALAQTDVAVVRTTLGADTPDTLNPSEVEARLVALGFRPIATDAGRHPGVGHALYVREQADVPATQAALAQCQQEAQRLQDRLASAQADNTQLTRQAQALLDDKARASEDHQKALQALSAQVADLQQARASAEQRAQALEQQAKAAAQAASAREQQLAQELQHLAEAQATSQTQQTALSAQVADLQQARASAEQRAQALEQQAKATAQAASTREQQLTQELQKATALAQERERQASTAQAQHEQLAAQKAALEHRLQQVELALQQAAQRERALEIAVHKAEAQLDAIKALWAREASA